MNTFFKIEGLCRLCLDDSDENPVNVFENVNFNTSSTISIAQAIEDITAIKVKIPTTIL